MAVGAEEAELIGAALTTRMSSLQSLQLGKLQASGVPALCSALEHCSSLRSLSLTLTKDFNLANLATVQHAAAAAQSNNDNERVFLASFVVSGFTEERNFNDSSLDGVPPGRRRVACA